MQRRKLLVALLATIAGAIAHRLAQEVLEAIAAGGGGADADAFAAGCGSPRFPTAAMSPSCVMALPSTTAGAFGIGRSTKGRRLFTSFEEYEDE
jgi:hypothetical protein